MFKQFLQASALQFVQIDSCRLGSVNENLAVLLMAYKFQGKTIMNHTDPQGMFFKSCQRPSKVIRQILPTQRKLVGLRFFFLSACVSSCRWSRAL